ncbi:MAG: 1-deoxy-D-xylulose-5-phosphate synthase [Clostridia bacterium]|nr:1-deoxy-D-xylulose-5-phosphate synthase [Clostridia bacterium]
MGSEKYDVDINKIKRMSLSELEALSQNIRERIIDAVSKNGGHLASNLGMVEPTVVLHKVFNSPEDTFIFDVSHQCYAHKIITGRSEAMDTLRKYNGISGFMNKNESEHDILNEGHSGSSISAALGIAEANRIKKNDSYVVAVVGDGALTNGMIYEALNNCSNKKLNLIILINDNEMSISRNVGGLHNYFSTIRTSKKYFRFKRSLEMVLDRIPLIGKPLAGLCKMFKDLFKRLFVKNNWFENIGLVYLGPVDGNNIEKLTAVLEEAKTKQRVTVVHMTTKKGKGYKFAEEHPEIYHGVAPFDKNEGVKISKKENFSSYMGKELCRFAEEDSSICAITAAMCDGTGLTEFANRFPERYFDVGIAEEHAITFAGGLSASGMKPFVALYSTFAQRAYDQLFHDVCIQNLPLVLALDRSGIVPGDGVTHQGIFDYSIFSTLPNVTIFSPESYSELSLAMKESFAGDNVSIIRYPRGSENIPAEAQNDFESFDNSHYSATRNAFDSDVLIVTYGRITQQAYSAAQKLKKDISVGVLKLNKICPINIDAYMSFFRNKKLIYFVEEGIKNGGVSEKIVAQMRCGNISAKIHINALDDYLPHGELDDLLVHCGLDSNSIAEEIISVLKN